MQFMQMKFHEEFHNLGRIQKKKSFCLLFVPMSHFFSVVSLRRGKEIILSYSNLCDSL